MFGVRPTRIEETCHCGAKFSATGPAALVGVIGFRDLHQMHHAAAAQRVAEADATTAHRCDTGHFDRTLCLEPCGAMHSYCATCDARQDPCAHEPAPTTRPHDAEETAK